MGGEVVTEFLESSIEVLPSLFECANPPIFRQFHDDSARLPPCFGATLGIVKHLRGLRQDQKCREMIHTTVIRSPQPFKCRVTDFNGGSNSTECNVLEMFGCLVTIAQSKAQIGLAQFDLSRKRIACCSVGT